MVPFKVKEKKSQSHINTIIRVLSSIFCLGGEVDPKKIFGATQRREKMFLGLLGRSEGMLPWKILKR